MAQWEVKLNNVGGSSRTVIIESNSSTDAKRTAEHQNPGYKVSYAKQLPR